MRVFCGCLCHDGDANAGSNLIHNFLGRCQEPTASGQQMGKVEVRVTEMSERTRYVIRVTT